MNSGLILLRRLGLESPRLWYRGINLGDASNIVRWRSDPQVYRYYRSPGPISIHRHLEWFSSEYCGNPSRAEFIILEKNSHRPIGFAGIYTEDSKDAELGYTIGECSARGRGFATETLGTLVSSFSTLGFSSFFLEIHPKNNASIRVAQKCGFSLSGHTALGFQRHTLGLLQ